jgi:hypothetical protein
MPVPRAVAKRRRHEERWLRWCSKVVAFPQAVARGDQGNPSMMQVNVDCGDDVPIAFVTVAEIQSI